MWTTSTLRCEGRFHPSGSVQSCRCYAVWICPLLWRVCRLLAIASSCHRRSTRNRILLECNPNTASTKGWQFIRCVCSEADAIDADVPLESSDATLFPGISSSIEAHSGFANEQAKLVKFHIQWEFYWLKRHFKDGEANSQLFRPLPSSTMVQLKIFFWLAGL